MKICQPWESELIFNFSSSSLFLHHKIGLWIIVKKNIRKNCRRFRTVISHTTGFLPLLSCSIYPFSVSWPSVLVPVQNSTTSVLKTVLLRMWWFRKARCTPPSTAIQNNQGIFFVAKASIPIFATLQFFTS